MNAQVILLVEDQIKMAEIMVRILQNAGYKVAHAPNGIKALELLNGIKPNIVLCDVNMPEMDGYVFLKLFKNSPANVNIPFLFLTANASYEDVREGMNLGADDYLFKPISRKDLLEAIDARLNKKHALQREIEMLKVKYAEEIAQKDDCMDEIGWNVSHVLRAPIANMMAIVDLMDIDDMSEKNKQLLKLLKPLPHKLDDAIRENVIRLNSFTAKKD